MPRRMCPRVLFKTEYSENVLPNFSVPPIGEEFFFQPSLGSRHWRSVIEGREPSHDLQLFARDL